VLKREHDGWLLTDEGHTYMHLTYDLDEKDLYRGTRSQIITNALSAFSVEDRDGELRLSIPNQHFGDALYSFVQAILKISDVTFLSRERIKSTFMEDVREFINTLPLSVPVSIDWSDPHRDPEGKYIVDFRIESPAKPLFVYALPNDDRVRDATIGLLQFERWGVQNRSVGIFEDQEMINRKVLARFGDACEKLFSNLPSNRDRIATFIELAMADH
jgi:hypothetical protein